MHDHIFRTVPLKTDIANSARIVAAEGRSDHAYVVADSPRSCPCRHCLQWAQAGERMILFPFAAIPPGVPYSEIGPIFVHADLCERYSSVSEYPEGFREGRVIRAYNARSEIIEAQLLNGRSAEKLISDLLADPATAFLHVRSATSGCYTFRIERA